MTGQGPRFDPATGRPLPVPGGQPGPGDSYGSGYPGYPGPPARPVRRSTLLRDLVLALIHLVVYVAVIGTLLVTVVGVGDPFGVFSRRVISGSFWPVFWPGFVWGTLIAGQFGAAVFQRRRLMGFVLGAMASVLLGAVLLSQVYPYRALAVVLACGSFAVSGIAIAVSLLVRPPAFLRSSPPPAPAAATATAASPAMHRRLISLPNILLGGIALLIVVSAMGTATFRAFEVRGSGEPGMREYPGLDFRQVSARGIDRLVIRQGDSPSVVVRGDHNLIGFVRVAVAGEVLDIGFDPGLPTSVRTDEPLVVEIVVPDVSEIRVGDRVRTVADLGMIDSLRVVADDQSRVELTLGQTTSLAVVARDDAVVELLSEVDAVAASVDDAARFDAFNVDLGAAVVDVDGSGMVTLGNVADLSYRQSAIGSISALSAGSVDPGSVSERWWLITVAGSEDAVDRR